MVHASVAPPGRGVCSNRAWNILIQSLVRAPGIAHAPSGFREQGIIGVCRQPIPSQQEQSIFAAWLVAQSG